ncbi:MAG: asparagine synthase B [Caldilineaceae bacterium]
MCGIAGIWGEVDQLLVQQVMDQMAHRGPDGSGMHLQSSQGVLGHRRLAIMDPTGGAQPIYNESGSASIVANGEIYNFPALRNQLGQHHHFSTTSDSEAILHLFEDQDVNLAQSLQGMFAFAIQQGDRLFLARDPIGIKPLYYGQRQGSDGKAQFYFASEMKALADWADNIHEFPPGHYYDSQRGFVQYYTSPTAPPIARPLAEQIKLVRQSLEDAVASHLMSDVPVGAFLSGGLDSSVIAAMARKHVKELHTFAVGVEGSNDVLAARKVAAHIGSIHHEYLFTPSEVIAKLPEIIHALESFDQDLVRSAIPCYFCSRLAADYVKVILTGEGADELFAGYKYHKEIPDPAILHRELCRTVTTLHNINLQRVDRLTMHHSIEGRVPFLDTHFIATSLSVHAEHKIVTMPNGQRMEKWILRKACEDLLPADIVWRTKEQFDEGSGTVNLLSEALNRLIEKIDAPTYQARSNEYLRSPEEAVYHKLLVDSYRRPQAILPNVARWVSNRIQ